MNNYTSKIFRIISLAFFGLIINSGSFAQCSSNVTPGSSILSSSDQTLLASWIPSGFEYEANLIYDSSVSGSAAVDVHAACDGFSNTVLVGITEQGNIIGGYNEGAWSSVSEDLIGLDNNFLFSISLEEVYPAIPGEVHITNSTNSLRFGGEFADLSLASDSNPAVVVQNNLGNSYECPAPVSSDCLLYMNDNQGWDGFNDRFRFSQWEVWHLQTSGTPLNGGVNADAGPDIVQCASGNFQLQAELAPGTSGTWSSNIGALNIQNVNNPNSFVGTIPQGFQVEMTWTVTDGICVSEDQVILENLVDSNGDGVCDVEEVLGCTDNTACNFLPEANISDGSCIFSSDIQPNVGSDYTFCSGLIFAFATVPVGEDIVEGLWTVDDPDVFIGAPNDNSTGVFYTPEGGSFSLTYTVTLGLCEQSDQFTLTHYAAPTEASVIDDTSFCEGTLFPLEGNLPDVGIGSWSVVEGPGTIEGSGTTVNAIVPDGTTTTYRYIITTDGEFLANFCSTFDDVTLTNDVSPAPADAGVNFIGCEPVTLNAEEATIGEGAWSSADLGISFTNENDPNTLVNGLSTGPNTLTWSVTNGSCVQTDNMNIGIYPDGCNDPVASNYDGPNFCNDGSCEYETLGCTDPSACNYNPNATQEDGTCEDLDECGVCGGNGIEGCTDPDACNYNEQAGCDNGSCLDLNFCGNCEVAIFGCTEPLADNYDPLANCTGAIGCIYLGCMNPVADNYDPDANTDDGSCNLVLGCTDVSACNYDSAAQIDTGCCIYPVGCESCSGETDGTGTVVAGEDLDGDGICDSVDDQICVELTEFLPESQIVNVAEQIWLMNLLSEEFHFESELVLNDELHTQSIDVYKMGNIPNTLMIMENECGEVFGGVNFGVWREALNNDGNPDYNYYPVENNFLFSLSQQSVLNTLNESEFIDNTPYSLPYYVTPESQFYDIGFGKDLYINWINPNLEGVTIKSQLGMAYQCPVGEQTDVFSNTDACDQYFQNGCPTNTISKIEVYALKCNGNVPGEFKLIEDGDCTVSNDILGCTDEAALNYNAEATLDDQSCIVVGCTEQGDPNYNPLAMFDDGSCESYASDNCLGDFNGDNAITISDLSGFLSFFGNTCDDN